MSLPLSTLYSLSPYLAELSSVHSGWLEDARAMGAGAALRQELIALREEGRFAAEEAISIALRRAKGRIALLAAIAETQGEWTTADSTRALSDLADAALDAALDTLMRGAAAKGSLAAAITSPTGTASGLALFALGKHGGRELNYSSDIDIVAFFDPDCGVLAEPGEATRFYSRLVQRLVGLMQDRTAHGYVFRTDLRLRPDPGSTPVAISVGAALAYYESRGQNWERAAWIKARACSGDRGVGEGFLAELAPYIWRKHLDYATIADIQAMKRQINISKNVGDARVAGHNVKLGRGGIREIEFFTQTQQLIAGGRDKSLRVRPTADALEALAAARWISPQTARDLTETYWFLRAVENRLQMRRDEQTHSMPEEPNEIGAVAVMMGYADVQAFEERYRQALATTSHYYAQLFAEGESLGAAGGNLVFTGSDDDPGTLETLAGLGFADPATASTTIRKWHYGGYPATRAAVSRAHLTELLPALLSTIANAGNADEALKRFDAFLARLPSGVQLFALLRTHAQLRGLLVAFMASAPRMAEAVIHRAHVMDALLDPAFANEVMRPAALTGKVEAFLGEARDYQEVIDRARIVAQEQKFLISAGLLSGDLAPERAAFQFTNLAETLLGKLFEAVCTEFEKRHGRVPGAEVALLAFGKMASREMTATSDLDFILLYDAPDVSADSDGAKPLAASHYFARLTQRLVAAVSAPTSEGVLYEADMRLRPSGNAGPLATPLSGFLAYQRANAWTWEHLALSRARVVLAPAAFRDKIEQGIDAVLRAPRDRARVIVDVREMRALMARERPARHRYDLKLITGGLVDLEFIAQSGQLLERERLGLPQGQTGEVLRRLGSVGLFPQGERLAEIHALYASVLQVMSAALLDPLKPEGWTDAFRDLLAQLLDRPSFARLDQDLAEMQAEVSAASAAWFAPTGTR